ncbi:MAG: CHAT domain-containing tetratricopeptide repeat protein [Chitinophagaceae bacterium]
MGTKIIIIFLYCLASATNLSGQCISRDSLWNRLLLLWYSPPGPPAEQLKELLKYDADMENCKYKHDSTHAFLLFRIGATYHRQADYLSGVQYARQSIDMVIRNADRPSMNLKHVIKYYYFLSVMFDSLTRVTEQMKALDSCIAFAKKLKVLDLFWIAALDKRAEYFYDVGDYYRCFSYADNGEKLAMEYAVSGVTKDSMAALEHAANCFQWQVNALLQLKNNELAETLLTRKIDEFKKNGGEIYLATLYHQLATVKVNQGDYFKAEFYYKQALDQAKKFRFGINCKVILNDLGYSVYFKQYHDWDKALRTYRKALTFGNNSNSANRNDAIESLNILANIAGIYVKKGLYDSAFYYFQLAFDQVKPGSTENDLLHSSLDDFIKTKRIYYLTALLVDKGNAYQQQFNNTGKMNFLQDAIRVYKITDRFLDRVKAEQLALQSKLLWRSDSKQLYEHAIEACYLSRNINDAFVFFERSRAVLLNDQLNEQRWLGQNDILKQVQLKKSILGRERELNRLNPSSENYRKVQGELFSIQQELDGLVNSIKVKNPLYYQNFLDSNFTSLAEIQKEVLPEYSALVEIFSGDSVLYCLVITRQEARLTKINKNNFDRLTHQYIAYISNPDLVNRNFAEFVTTSNDLYKLIFLDNPVQPGRIIISPDSRYFPFEALVTQTNPLTYFLNDHAVSYTYSGRYLTNRFVSSSVNASNNFLGFAPVQYAAAMNLSPLWGSDNSLNKIRSYFSGGDKLIASKASRNNFIQKFYQYRVIQLYTHASDSSVNGEPVIFFADSAIYLSDLIPDKMPATSLIVLSACETGSGRLQQGEGVFSFNRGFAALGIPSAVINLWSVDNEATYRLTEIFYKYLADGLSADVALQRAKLNFLQTASKEKKLPGYWAAAVLVGRADTIELKKTNSPKNAIFLSSLFFIAGCIAWWKWRRKKADL